MDDEIRLHGTLAKNRAVLAGLSPGAQVLP